mmetsp:Transcript_3488/g.4044  ORF Transcript_3488/g.4044 Transcript_3488/m.4044 type:complete len:101 (-) Transcript_3488:115-417(-)
MLRHHVFLTRAAVCIAVWYQALKKQDDIVILPLISKEYTTILIQYLPVWILITIAIYALITILYGLATLENCPEAKKDLEKEILEAKAEMGKREIRIQKN